MTLDIPIYSKVAETHFYMATNIWHFWSDRQILDVNYWYSAMSNYLAICPLFIIYFCRYIVLMSGLNTSRTADHMFSMHLFMEWLSGLSGTSEYQEEVSKIVRVIVAGKVILISLAVVV